MKAGINLVFSVLVGLLLSRCDYFAPTAAAWLPDPPAANLGPNQIYTSDSDNSRIVRIDDMGGADWVDYGASGAGPGQFDLHYGLFKF